MSGAASDDDAERRGHDVEPFRDFLADAMQTAAAGAGQAVRLDDLFDARQVFGQHVGGTRFGAAAARSSASSSPWITAIAVSRSSSASSNWSGSSSPISGRIACLKAAISFSSRAMRASLRLSRASAAISIPFSAAISSSRSAAFGMARVYHGRSDDACPKHRPSHPAAGQNRSFHGFGSLRPNGPNPPPVEARKQRLELARGSSASAHPSRRARKLCSSSRLQAITRPVPSQ